MRVKIMGEITLERMVEALSAAQRQYETAVKGGKFYGANLYLTGFTPEGLPCDLVDHRGQPLIIVLHPESGEVARPALTAEGARQREERREEAARQNAEEKERFRKEQEDWKQQNEALDKERMALAASVQSANNMTKKLMETMPGELIDNLNRIVDETWNDLKPLETHGKLKGEAKAKPYFRILDGELFIFSSAIKTPKRVLNPYCKLEFAGITTHWLYPAWREASDRIEKYMTSLASNAEPIA
jgi:hypothetical protein